jgi:hypothetical protein
MQRRAAQKPYVRLRPLAYVMGSRSRGSIGCPPDEDITSIHTMNGPITRSRARQLNLQVRSTLVNCVSELTLGAMDVLMIRNLGEDQQGLGKGLGVEEEQQGHHNRKEIKSDSAPTPSRVPGPVCTKMDAQDASGLRLRQT